MPDPALSSASSVLRVTFRPFGVSSEPRVSDAALSLCQVSPVCLILPDMFASCVLRWTISSESASHVRTGHSQASDDPFVHEICRYGPIDGPSKLWSGPSQS